MQKCSRVPTNPNLPAILAMRADTATDTVILVFDIRLIGQRDDLCIVLWVSSVLISVLIYRVISQPRSQIKYSAAMYVLDRDRIEPYPVRQKQNLCSKMLHFRFNMVH